METLSGLNVELGKRLIHRPHIKVKKLIKPLAIAAGATFIPGAAAVASKAISVVPKALAGVVTNGTIVKNIGKVIIPAVTGTAASVATTYLTQSVSTGKNDKLVVATENDVIGEANAIQLSSSKVLPISNLNETGVRAALISGGVPIQVEEKISETPKPSLSKMMIYSILGIGALGIFLLTTTKRR